MTRPDQRRAALSLAALGVVYGDIGTSPLYAMRECFVGVSGFPVDHPNVFGILSLITWSLVVVVSFKYLLLVLRADNQGEGGILALAHCIVPDEIEDWTRKHWVLVGVGLFGAALLFGDGIITPALSVLSAVEGLRVAQPTMGPFVVPLALGILAVLFSVQRFGTGRVAQLFGPITLAWFLVLGGTGLYQILQHPHVLNGLNPVHAVRFFGSHGFHGTLILGAVFLAVTGAEALYADLGHFGPAPIRRSWLAVVFPGLLLNYFGQGSLLLRHPELVDDVFYQMVPGWASIPLVVMATAATVIASQAVISGVFSLTAQAVQLDYFPRAVIEHTSSTQRGQIYVPAANKFLFVGTVALVLMFQSSGSLADAYGIAVSLTMVITTVLLFFVMADVWKWPTVLAVSVTAVLLAVDLAFFGSIVRKIAHGGWIPLSIGVVLVLVMGVWRRGRQLLARYRPQVDPTTVPASDSTLVFLVRDPAQVSVGDGSGPRHILLYVNQCHRPYMIGMPHGEVRDDNGRVYIYACFGFMETPRIPELLAELDTEHQLGLERVRYVVIRELFDPHHDRGMPGWMKRMFGLLSRHATRIPTMLGIPQGQVVEVNPFAER